MEIENYKAVNKGFIVGKFDLLISKWGGMKICDCVYFAKAEKKWISFPCKEYINKEGEKKYYHLIKFDSEFFQKMQCKLLEMLGKLNAVPEPVKQDETMDFPF